MPQKSTVIIIINGVTCVLRHQTTSMCPPKCRKGPVRTCKKRVTDNNLVLHKALIILLCWVLFYCIWTEHCIILYFLFNMLYFLKNCHVLFICHQRVPAVLREVDIGPCKEKWSWSYLEQVGGQREVRVHVGSNAQMDFLHKNFAYRYQSTVYRYCFVAP